MPKLDDAIREALKKQHGPITVLSSPALKDHEFAFRRCGVAEFDAYLSTAASRETSTKVQANRQLARDLLVFPEPKAWEELSTDLPGLAHTFGDELARIAGLNADVIVGKG